MKMMKTVLGAAVLLAVGTGSANAMTTTGNNFTMLGGTGLLTGGTNDVTFTWDGTLKTAVVTDGSSNASLSSPTPFFGKLWTAHHVNVYGPGSYTFYAGCAAGDPSCGVGTALSFTVPAGYIGAHMLFNWSTSANIDVLNLWQPSASWDATGSADPFCASPLTTGGCSTNPNPNGNTRYTTWSYVSVDTPIDADAYHGTKMVDGPFVGQSANFNVQVVPVPAAVWLLGSGLLGLVGIARRKKKA